VNLSSGSMAGGVEDEIASWQATRRFLATLPRAADLRKARIRGGRVLRLRCDRSLPFEYVAGFLDPFLATWGARHEIEYSGYDPGLTGVETRSTADLRILFLDWRLHLGQLSPEDAARWARTRLQAALRAGEGRAPVLINDWPDCDALNRELRQVVQATPGALLIGAHAVAQEMGTDPFDARNDAVSRFPFSNQAAVALARHLALDLFPPLTGERIKAVVLDLDDTLWKGVLGEDGAAGIRVLPGHQRLQEKLRRLKERGVLLAVCSRNDPTDVERAFAARSDLGLALNDFASVRVGWTPKAQALGDIARDLNIHPSAMLFIDDNGAELARARAAHGGLRILLADPEGAETAAALGHFPGLFPVAADVAAALRTADIQANREREKLRGTAGANLAAYLAALKMQVEINVGRRSDAPRLYELSQKTNQFNLGLARISPAQAAEAFGAKSLVMTVSLKDALSDSGLVGAIVAAVEGKVATVREVVFSCRVLGRDIETLALWRFCGRLAARGVAEVRFAVAEGPRNKPARDWLARILPEGTQASLALLTARLQGAQGHPAAITEVVHGPEAE
jgi:FkbH-like protein